MKEYQFTIQYDDYSAQVLLGGEWSLYDFAEFIIQTVGFDFDHAFQFCDHLKNPYRAKESYSLFADMGDAVLPTGRKEGSVHNTKVSQVFRARRKMLFHFDYGDDWFFLVTCNSVRDSETKQRFHKIISSQGEPPVQYPDWDEDEEE